MKLLRCVLLMLLPLLTALPACQGTGGVVRMSGDSYTISKSSAAGAFANAAKMQAAVLQEADAFAAGKGGVAVPSGQGMVLDRPAVGFPTCTYTFEVVDAAQYAQAKERKARDLAALSPAQRVALQQAELDRKAYNTRTQVLAQPVEHHVTGSTFQNVNVNGAVRQDVNVGGTLYVR